MTTKKKSLLGIGCLSVAMLSISLLMTNPISADGYTLDSSYQTGFTEGKKVGYHEGLYPYDNSPYQSPSETHPNDKDYAKGYSEGFQHGYREGKEKYTNKSIFGKIWYWFTSFFVTR